MIDLLTVKEILKQHGIQPSGEPVEHGESPNNIFVFVSVERDTQNRQVPSNKTINSAREAFQKLGITVEFLLVDGVKRDVEAGLRATLLHAFGRDVRNVFLSVNGNLAHVWVDPKRQLDEAIRKTITQKATIFLSELDLNLTSLSTVTGENLPGSFALLRAIRQLAPVDAPSLMSYFLAKNLTIPSLDWLNRRLDALRKSGKIVRLGSGSYVLGLGCLRELGTEKNGSSDISVGK